MQNANNAIQCSTEKRANHYGIYQICPCNARQIFRLKQAKLTLNSNWLDFECDCALSLSKNFDIVARRCVEACNSIFADEMFRYIAFQSLCMCATSIGPPLLYALANCLHSSVYQSAITNN